MRSGSILTAAALCCAFVAITGCSDDGSSPGGNQCGTMGELRCTGNQIEICGSDGLWVFSKDCASQSQICVQGVCTDDTTVPQTCEPGVSKCVDMTVVHVCTSEGTWRQLADCAAMDQICQDGQCTGCAQGAYRCRADDGTSIEQCNGEGMWTFYRDCADSNKICSNGICRDAADGDDDAADTVEVDTRPQGDQCDDTNPCTDAESYCFMYEDETQGVCLKFCDLDNNCPQSYGCNPDTFRCEPFEGYCTSGGQCMAGREFCDIQEDLGWGICKPYCYLPGEACPAGTKCCLEDSVDTDCAGRDGKCISTLGQCSSCYSDFDCGTMAYCDKIEGQNIGCCRPKCGDDEDCPGGLVCRDDGRCGSGNANCDCGGQCPRGYVCDPIYCQCVLNCPALGPNECCDADSAPLTYPCRCINPTFCGFLMPEQCCEGYNCSAWIYGVLGNCL